MTTTQTGLPPMRPFTREECDALVSAGIIAEGERAAVLCGTRLFNVDEYLDMARAGILQKEDRIELIDGKIIVMAPIGIYHLFSTDWFTMLLANAAFRPGHRARAGIHTPAQLQRARAGCCRAADALLRRHTPLLFPTTFTSSSRSRTAPCDMTAAPSWHATPPPASPRCGSPTCRCARSPFTPTRPARNTAASSVYRPGDSISPGAFPDVVLAVDEFMPPATHGRDAETSA